MPEAQALLPLDQPRVIAIRDGKFTYTFHFARIGKEDWLTYFRGIDYTSRNTGNGEEITLDADFALTRLAESKLERAEGYPGDFMSKEDWRNKVPLRHLRPAAVQFIDVQQSSVESEKPFDPESIEVTLDAKWSNVGYAGLVHRFNPVTVELKRRFFRAGATSRVIGSGRNGTTVHGMRHSVLLDAYDELVQCVDGYSVGGKELRGEKDAILREMDAFHKVKAAEQLFTGATQQSSVAA
ncbi:MAG TPA: hypothetical protein VJW20_20220 [Candidatus Angelobacter sp.]|nr:hypothetical protein [Candidatus Angelobacter sp.]